MEAAPASHGGGSCRLSPPGHDEAEVVRELRCPPVAAPDSDPGVDLERIYVDGRPPCVRSVDIAGLSCNFGTLVAVGVARASGDAVATMNADLPHPPENMQPAAVGILGVYVGSIYGEAERRLLRRIPR